MFDCQAQRALVFRLVIAPITAQFYRERFIADFADLRYYSNQNNGFGWLFVMIDLFSKYCWTAVLFEKSALAVSNTFRNVFGTFGSPFIFHTDNGKEFCNTSVSDICNEFNIRHVKDRARCPRTQGQVERCNQPFNT